MKNHLFNLIIGVSFFSFSVCGNAAEKRAFHEVNIEPEEQQAVMEADPQAMMQNMPDDDIHAAFRKNQGAGQAMDMNAMPDDDIHKKFKSGSAMSGGMPMDPALMNSVAPTSLTWTTPEGWKEEKGSGMRIVTFSAGEGDLAVETSVISLAGAAGGMPANVTRWMGQLGLEIPSPEKLDEFIKEQQTIKTQSGVAVTVVDFTQLQADAAPDAPSMIAAVIDGENNQVFLKMTGSKQAVLENFDAFKALVSSLKDNSKT